MLATALSGSLWRTESRQEIVAATTLYLYAVETYGIERFPPLLEALVITRAGTRRCPRPTVSRPKPLRLAVGPGCPGGLKLGE